MIPMNVDGIQEVAWLVPAGKREDLVDGEVDRVQLKTYIRVGDRRQKTPSRIVRPFHLGRFLAAFDDRPDEARLAEHDLDRVSRGFKQSTVSSERFGHQALLIVKIIEIVADAGCR
jgi:predicted ATPase